MAGLLLHDRTLIVQPSLVRQLGLREAVVVQQLHWHLTDAEHGQTHEGHSWFPVTYTVFAAELGLTADVVRRSIETLEAAGIVVSCQPEGHVSRRKWYRIDLTHEAFVQLADVPDGTGNGAASGSGVDAASSSSKTKRESKPRARFEEYDALVEVWGEPGTREETAFFARVAHSLKAQGKSPSEIVARGKVARQRHADCTVNVLLTRWSNFAPPAQRRRGGSFDDVARRDREARGE